MMITLYKITNAVNQKAYIGWTSQPLQQRWRQHQYTSSQCVALRNAIQKHGASNFIREELEICSSETYAKLLEIAAIKGFGTKTPDGYNMTNGGDGTMGIVCSETTKQKIRQAKTGTKRRPFSEEHKRNLSAARRTAERTPCSEETKRKISIANTGKHRTEEHKQKLSEANKGKNNPHFGKQHTEETKRKIGIASRNRKIKR